MRGWCLGAAGRSEEGLPLLLEGIEMRRATGANLLIPFYLMTLAEAYGIAAQPQEGLDRLAEAAKLIETTQERWIEAEIHRLRGTLLLSMQVLSRRGATGPLIHNELLWSAAFGSGLARDLPVELPARASGLSDRTARGFKIRVMCPPNCDSSMNDLAQLWHRAPMPLFVGNL
jgi:hypothetical protein